MVTSPIKQEINCQLSRCQKNILFVFVYGMHVVFTKIFPQSQSLGPWDSKIK